MWPLPCARMPGSTALMSVDHAEVVGVEELADLGVLALLDRRHVAVAGVVDQHVDAAEASVRGRHGVAASARRSVTSSATANAVSGKASSKSATSATRRAVTTTW